MQCVETDNRPLSFCILFFPTYTLGLCMVSTGFRQATTTERQQNRNNPIFSSCLIFTFPATPESKRSETKR